MPAHTLLCRASLVASALAGLYAMPAYAQTADAAASSDDSAIVVTARRREESLVDVPIAITALTGALDHRGRAHVVTNTADARVVVAEPGVDQERARPAEDQPHEVVERELVVRGLAVEELALRGVSLAVLERMDHQRRPLVVDPRRARLVAVVREAADPRPPRGPSTAASTGCMSPVFSTPRARM